MSQSIRRSARHSVSGPRQGPVLILDSDRQIRTLLAEWLDRAGYDSVQAHPTGTPPEAAAQCVIVLVDVRSPLPSARHSVASALAAAPRAAIIAMSADGLASEPSAIEAVERELGVAAVLVKPFDREALMQALERASTGGSG